MLKIDGSLPRNIDFEVANLKARTKTRGKILKLQSVKIGGSLARKARFDAPTSLVSSLWFSCGVAVSMGKLQNLSFSKVSKQVVMSFCVAGVALYTLHSALYTPHCTLYTPPHPTLCTLLTPHFILYTLHATLHTRHFPLHTLHSTLYTPHSSLHNLHFTLLTPHSTIYTLHFPLPLHTLHFTLYTYTLHSTVYTLDSTL